MNYNQAVKELEKGNYKGCIDYFKDNNYNLEYAYSLLLSGNLKDAKRRAELHNSVRYDWLSKLIVMCEGEIEYPTYFQLRSFLEIDLSLLIKSGKLEYVNNLLKLAQTFQGINRESYKFFGRGLLKNGYPKEARYFLDKALEDYYNDVELHFLFVEYYLSIGEKELAKKTAERCLKINPEYYPAKKFCKESN